MPVRLAALAAFTGEGGRGPPRRTFEPISQLLGRGGRPGEAVIARFSAPVSATVSGRRGGR
jgi:hypothetical protein